MGSCKLDDLGYVVAIKLERGLHRPIRVLVSFLTCDVPLFLEFGGAHSCDVYEPESMCPLMERPCGTVGVPSCRHIGVIETSECSLLDEEGCWGNPNCLTRSVCRGSNSTEMDELCSSLEYNECYDHADCEFATVCSVGM